MVQGAKEGVIELVLDIIVCDFSSILEPDNFMSFNLERDWVQSRFGWEMRVATPLV